MLKLTEYLIEASKKMLKSMTIPMGAYGHFIGDFRKGPQGECGQCSIEKKQIKSVVIKNAIISTDKFNNMYIILEFNSSPNLCIQLYTSNSTTPKSMANYSKKFFKGVLRIAEAHKWHDLIGKQVRIEITTSELYKKSKYVSKIGHITENVWFDILS